MRTFGYGNISRQAPNESTLGHISSNREFAIFLRHYTIAVQIRNPLCCPVILFCCPVIYFASASRSWNENEKPQFKVYLIEKFNEEKIVLHVRYACLCAFLFVFCITTLEKYPWFLSTISSIMI